MCRRFWPAPQHRRAFGWRRNPKRNKRFGFLKLICVPKLGSQDRNNVRPLPDRNGFRKKFGANSPNACYDASTSAPSRTTRDADARPSGSPDCPRDASRALERTFSRVFHRSRGSFRADERPTSLLPRRHPLRRHVVESRGPAVSHPQQHRAHSHPPEPEETRRVRLRAPRVRGPQRRPRPHGPDVRGCPRPPLARPGGGPPRTTPSRATTSPPMCAVTSPHPSNRHPVHVPRHPCMLLPTSSSAPARAAS